MAKSNLDGPTPLSLWQKLKQKIADFYPGFKTKFIAVLGALGSAAAVAQGYIAGLPLGEFSNVKTLLIVNIVLFTLVYFFRDIAKPDVA